MWPFSNIISIYKKCEAAALVECLIEPLINRGYGHNIKATPLATLLVSAIWDNKPDIFEGRFGQRPHKISVAATALAEGIALFKNDVENKMVMAVALGNMLSELEVNGNLYPLSSMDISLIGAAAAVLKEMSEDFS